MAGQEELCESEATEPEFNIMDSRDDTFINVLWIRQVGVVPPVDVIKAQVKGNNETISLEVRDGDDPAVVFQHPMAFQYFYHRAELETTKRRLERAAELAALDQEDAAIRTGRDAASQINRGGVFTFKGGEKRHIIPHWAE